MKRILFFSIFLIILAAQGYAQHNTRGRKKIDIPFEFENNFIIVKIRFNKVLPLKFIFDTGAEYTILTKRELAEMIGVQYAKEFKIVGADMKTILTAYLARNVGLEIGSIENPNQDFLVMGEDYFKFEPLTGVEVHGIIGANFFSRYVVKINYRKKVISLYSPQHYTPPKGYQEIPINIFKKKPYLEVSSKLFRQDSLTNLKLLLDTGASLTFLLYNDTHPALKLPERVVRGNIGKGLGGEIEGFIGRFHEISVPDTPFKLNNLIANYQEIYDYMDSIELNDRNGLIGNMVLSRFDIIIDYHKQILYIKPNKNYKKDFRFDRSGLSFLASGPELNTYTVNNVVPGSPAEEAGILKGDQLRKVNWIPVAFLSMGDLSRKLQGKVGKQVKMVLIRDKKKIKVTFKLRDII